MYLFISNVLKVRKVIGNKDISRLIIASPVFLLIQSLGQCLVHMKLYKCFVLITIAQCLASYFKGSGEISMVFSIVFQASTGKKLRGKIQEKILGPANLMLNIPLLCS